MAKTLGRAFGAGPLRGPGRLGKGYCNSSSSAIHSAATASDGIRQSPHETLRVPWGPGYLKSSGGVNPPCGKVFAHGENAWTRLRRGPASRAGATGERLLQFFQLCHPQCRHRVGRHPPVAPRNAPRSVGTRIFEILGRSESALRQGFRPWRKRLDAPSARARFAGRGDWGKATAILPALPSTVPPPRPTASASRPGGTG